jgi:DNA-binding HxlR family transcriptional regulator
MAKTRHRQLDCSPGCPVEGTLQLIGGKWKGVILYHLLGGTLRFNELRRQLRHCTQRMLTNQLRELEADGLIERKVHAEVPPKVEYSLSARGRSLEPVIMALRAWGEANVMPAAHEDLAGAIGQSGGCSSSVEPHRQQYVP